MSRKIYPKSSWVSELCSNYLEKSEWCDAKTDLGNLAKWKDFVRDVYIEKKKLL
jgi:hypothetical protein